MPGGAGHDDATGLVSDARPIQVLRSSVDPRELCFSAEAVDWLPSVGDRAKWLRLS